MDMDVKGYMDLLDFFSAIQPLHIFLLLTGIILVIVEMFHPGFGAPGITGTILLLLGIVLTAKTPMQVIILVSIILVILGLALAAVINSAAKGRLSRTLVLSHSQQKKSGYIGTEDLEEYLGREGYSVTVLRPAGVAEFSGIRLDVVSVGDYIPAGKKVKVVKVEGRRVVVRDIT